KKEPARKESTRKESTKKDSTATSEVNWFAGDSLTARWTQVPDSAGTPRSKLDRLIARGSARSFTYLASQHDTTGPSLNYSRGTGFVAPARRSRAGPRGGRAGPRRVQRAGHRVPRGVPHAPGPLSRGGPAGAGRAVGGGISDQLTHVGAAPARPHEGRDVRVGRSRGRRAHRVHGRGVGRNRRRPRRDRGPPARRRRARARPGRTGWRGCRRGQWRQP